MKSPLKTIPHLKLVVTLAYYYYYYYYYYSARKLILISLILQYRGRWKAASTPALQYKGAQSRPR